MVKLQEVVNTKCSIYQYDYRVVFALAKYIAKIVRQRPVNIAFRNIDVRNALFSFTMAISRNERVLFIRQ